MLKGFAFKKFGMISRVCLQILNLSLGFGGQSRRDIFPVTSLIHWLLKNYPVASCGGITPAEIKNPGAGRHGGGEANEPLLCEGAE